MSEPKNEDEMNEDVEDERNPNEETGRVKPMGGMKEEGQRSESETRLIEIEDSDENYENELNDENEVNGEDRSSRSED